MMVRVALRNVMRHRLRTAFTVAALAIAVALLADMLMLSNGMEKTFYRVLSSVGYEVRVCPWGTLPFSTDAAIAESSRVVRALDDEPHVERWLRVLGTTLYSDSTSLFAMGIDGSEQSLYTVTGGVDLNAAPADDRANVVLNENAAEALGVDVGDEIELRTGVTSDRTAFVVVGIIALAFDLPQQRTIVMPMDVVYHLRPEMRDAASFVLVKLKTPASPSNSFAPLDDQRAVAASLAAEFPELSVYSLDQLMEALQGQLAYFKQFALVLSTISVFITFLLIAVVLTIGVGERRGEIARDVEHVDPVDEREGAGRDAARGERPVDVERPELEPAVAKARPERALGAAQEERRELGEPVRRHHAGVEPLEERFRAAAEPAAELEDRAAPVCQCARRGDRSDRVRDRVQRVRVREVLRPRDDPFGAEQRLLAGELAAQHRRIALGCHRGDAKGRQAALVVRDLRRDDLLRVECRQPVGHAEAGAVGRPRHPLGPAVRGGRREQPRRRDAGDVRGESRASDRFVDGGGLDARLREPGRPERRGREPRDVLHEQIAGTHEDVVEERPDLGRDQAREAVERRAVRSSRHAGRV